MDLSHHSSDVSRLLTEAGKVLANSLDYNAALESIARLAVSELADVCTIDLVENGLPRRLTITHRNPHMSEYAKDWQKRWPPTWTQDRGTSNVMMTGTSEIYPEVTDKDLRAAARSKEHYEALTQMGIKSAMIVPLIASGNIYGAITFVGAESGRKFCASDLIMAEEMGRQGGVAIANAQLYKMAKNAQAAAEPGKELFRTLSETLPQLVWTAHPDGRLDYFNNRWEEFCGRKPEDTPEFWKWIIHPDHLDLMYEKWRTSLETGTLYELTLALRERNGNYAWYLSRGFPTKDSQGNVVKWFGACTNIDAQKRQEDRIQKLQDLTSAVSRAVTQTEIGDVLLRHVTKISGARATSIALLNFDASKIELTTATRKPGALEDGDIQLNLPREVSFSDRDPVCLGIRDQKKMALETKSEVLAAFPHLQDVAGLCVLPLVFQGRSLGAMAIYFDYERKISEEELRFCDAIVQQASQALERARLFESELYLRHHAEESELRLKFLAEASTILSENLDHEKTLKNIVAHAVPYFSDGCFVDLVMEEGSINRIAASYYDPRKGNLLFDLVKAHRPHQKSPINHVLSTGESLLMDLEDNRNLEFIAQGRQDILDMVKSLNPKSIILVHLGPKEKPIGVMSFFTSVSGRIFDKDDVSLAEELGRRATVAIENARLYNQAREAIRMRDEFLSIASHELKTPLTSICLQLQLVKRNKEIQGSENEKLLKAFDVFDSQSLRLSKLIDSLLDISLIQSGRLSLDLEPLDLSEMVTQVIDRLPLIERPQLDLQSGVKGYWDRSRLDQVVVNLVSNAIKYGGNKPIKVTVGSSGTTAFISVQDFGVGIAKQDQKRIFDRFQRAVSDRRTWGMGLGLYIAKQIVDSHRGIIKLKSQVGQGSTFTVEIPRDTMTIIAQSPREKRPIALH
jgi:PAS domain S-box-containing protein